MQEIIIKNLMAQLDLERDAIKPESRFVEDFSMDSLDMVEMLIDLEKHGLEFGLIGNVAIAQEEQK